MPVEMKLVLQRNMRAALRRGAWEDAASILARLKQADPLSQETRGLELELLVKLGRLAEAEVLATQLTHLFPGSARMHYLAGRLHYKRKAYERAEQHLRESVRIHPHDVPRRYLGKTLTQLGRLDEAETILVQLAENGREVSLDLAWLFERRQDYSRALRLAERHLERYPDDVFAQGQRRRLLAKLLPPDELVQDIEALREFGEAIPADLLPEFISNLLRSGLKRKAREVLEQMDPKSDPQLAQRLGWVCYKLQAYDLSLDLFLCGFPAAASNVKFLSALERAADRCERLEELIALYEQHAPDVRHLYGRAAALKRRMKIQGD